SREGAEGEQANHERLSGVQPRTTRHCLPLIGGEPHQEPCEGRKVHRSAPGPIRTADLAFRKRLLYPPELRGRLARTLAARGDRRKYSSRRRATPRGGHRASNGP